MTRSVRHLLLALLLLMVQQLGLTHGYAHAGDPAAHVHAHDDEIPSPAAACLDCVALAAIAATPASTPPVCVHALPQVLLSSGAVPPAPTFPCRTAFDSRAPPRVQS
jgi:hypothetical protein